MKIRKIIYRLFFLVVIAAGIYAAYYSAEKNIDSSRKSGESEEPFFAKESMRWEFERHKDPQTGNIPRGIYRAQMDFVKNLPGAYGTEKNKRDKIMEQKWQPRGPFNIGGRTRALGLDIRDENVIISGGVSGGMWKSTDGGNIWVKKSTPLQLQSVSCLTQDTRPGKEDTWYYGSGEYFNIYGGLRGDGIYKSTDNGETWFPLESTLSNRPDTWNGAFDYVWNIITNHTNAEQDEVLAATAAGGIFRSVDGGETWEAVLGGGFGYSYPWYTDIAISKSGVMYASLSQKTFSSGGTAIDAGIYRSENGTAWTNITPENFPQFYRRVVIGISPSDENQVYFFGETPESGVLTFNSRGDSLWHSFWKYTYISGDGSNEGGQWEDRSLNLPSTGKTRMQMNTQGSYDMVIAVKPDDPDVVFIGGTNLYRSADGFQSPENTTLIGGYCPDGFEEFCVYDYRYPNHHADQHAITFSRINPDIMFTGSDGGVHKTLECVADTVEWISLNQGYITTQFYTCAIDRGTPGSEEIIGGLQDNGTLFTRWADFEKGWTNPNQSDGFYCNIEDGGDFYYAAQNSSLQPKHKIYRIKLDEDGERTVRTRIDPIGGRDFMWVNPYRLDPNNQKRMYLAGGEIVWRNNNLDAIPVAETTDSITTEWDSIPETRVQSGRISALCVSGTPANLVYFATSSGKVFKMENAGTKNPIVTDITSQRFPSNAFAGGISVDPNDGNKVFVVFHNFNIKSVFYSEDAGETWRHVTGNLEENPNGSGAGPACYWVEVLPIGEKNLYFLGTSTGLYSTSFIEGESVIWRQEGTETIGNSMVYMLDARQSDGFVAAATHGVGMFSAKIDRLHEPLASAPVLTAPLDVTKGVLTEVTLEWQPLPGAGNYKVEIAEDAGFDNIIGEYEGITGTSIEIKNLQQGLKIFYWRVAARNEGGYSPYSPVWSFSTAAAPPELVYPENSADSLEASLSLKWLSAEGADSYHLLIAKDPGFNIRVIDTSGVEGEEFFAQELEYGKLYFWKVSSIGADGEGIFSESRIFKTKKLVSAEENYHLSVSQIGHISPNPAQNYARLSFILKKGSHVEVEIAGLNAHTVKKIPGKYYSEGRHNKNIDLSMLAPGVYFCILKIDGKVISKAFTVIN